MNATTASTAAFAPATGEPVGQAGNVVALAPDASGHLCVLLAQRDRHPHAGMWGLPGGVCVDKPGQPWESPLDVAVRRCQEKTGVRVEPEALVFASSRYEGSDAVRHYVTLSYAVMLDRPVPAAVGDMVRAVRWWPVSAILNEDEPSAEGLAFDHAQIIRDAIAALGVTAE
ncbi:MAG TPA: NUDIX domain-containing protein [Streptomyces sp.]